jgi:predicted permease
VSDLRHAWRSLLRTRGFVAVAVGTLSAGIALSVSVMALCNAYLMHGLPYPESDRLYWIRNGQGNGPFVRDLETLDWRALDDIVEHPIAWDLDLFNLRGAPYAEAAQGAWVTSGYMAGFGVRPARGRGFTDADFQAGAPSVALISHRLWQTRFGGSPDAVGRTFEAYVNDRPGEPQRFTIVGVLPDRMWHLNVFTEVLAPLRAASHPYMVRLRRGVTPETLAARVDSLVRSGGLAIPDGWRVGIESAHADYVRQVRPLLIALATAAGLVMLIACANVAVLFTVRATHRQREIAVRKALGASAGRIARALASEAIVLAAVATSLGLAVAQAILMATAPVLERSLGRGVPGGAARLQIDVTGLGAGLAAGLLVVLVCCAAQLWTSRRAPLTQALTGGQKGASAGPQQRRAHAALIAIEVAACLTLLVGAALMIQSGLRILRVDMGLEARDVLVGRLSLNQTKYPDAARRNAFYDRVVGGVETITGRREIAFAAAWPLQAAPEREVSADAATAAPVRAGVIPVSAGYFDTLSIEVQDGRAFTTQDGPGTEPVAVVSRALAARLWPGRRAVGERIRIAAANPQSGTPSIVTVVGVAEDARHAHTDRDLTDVYLAFSQSPYASAFMYVRGAGAAPRLERDLRELLTRLDPDMALGMARPLSEILDQQRAGSRFLATLLTVFAALAAALALVGIYGVIAYTVRQREREIAIRLAIGADRATITRLFVRQGAAVLAIGVGIGLAGGMMIGRVLRTQLFGVAAADPLSIAIVSLSFACCGLLAVGWPARAAASTDPAAALKN